MNKTLFPEYYGAIEYLENIKDTVDADIQFGELYVDKDNKIIFTVTINLDKSNEQWQDFGFDFNNDFYNGENFILEAIKHQIKKDHMDTFLKPQLDDIYTSQKYTDFLNKRLQEHFSKSKTQLQYSATPSLFSQNEEIRQAVIDNFEKLANGQRDKPEHQMLKTIRLIGGGELSYLLEHIGDLTHRISQKTHTFDGSIEGTINYILPKIDNALNILNREHFLDNFNNEIESNYNFNFKNDEKFRENFPTLDDFKNKIKEEMLIYSNLHSELPTFNKIQRECQMAALELGREGYQSLRKHLINIQEIIYHKNFVYEASICDSETIPKHLLNQQAKTKHTRS